MIEITLLSLFGLLTTGFFAYRKPSTLTYLAKLFFFIFLLSFLSLLMIDALNSAPPAVHEPMPGL